MTLFIWPIALPYLYLVSGASAANILLFLSGTTVFERQTFELLAQQLARRHHNAITVKPILIPEEPRLVQPRLHFVTEKILRDLLPKRLYEPLESVRADVPWRDEYSVDGFQEPYWDARFHACKKILNSNLMEVLARDRIDVAVVYASDPCQLGLVHALGLPFVYVDLEGVSDETRIAAGVEWSLGVGGAVARLSRFAKLSCEFIAQLEPFDDLISRLPCGRRVERLDAPISRLFAADYAIRQKFRGDFPTVNEIKRLADIYLANTDELLENGNNDFGRWPSNLLLVGGMHIELPRPLFFPWNESIASAAHGVIVVSFGTLADTSAMPARLAVALFDALARLDGYRVFWRLAPRMILPGIGSVGAGTNLTRPIPTHFNFTTFLPQNELLAQRRCRLLITNGGAHSVLEALTYGIPMLGLPLYGANRATLDQAARRGLAVVVEKTAASEKILGRALRQLLHDSRCLTAAREMSREIARRPATALERAIHAIETVARRGRLRRRAAAASPRCIAHAAAVFWQLNVDIWIATTVFLTVFLLITYITMRTVLRSAVWLIAISIWVLRKSNLYALNINANSNSEIPYKLRKKIETTTHTVNPDEKVDTCMHYNLCYQNFLETFSQEMNGIQLVLHYFIAIVVAVLTVTACPIDKYPRECGTAIRCRFPAMCINNVCYIAYVP